MSGKMKQYHMDEGVPFFSMYNYSIVLLHVLLELISSFHRQQLGDPSHNICCKINELDCQEKYEKAIR